MSELDMVDCEHLMRYVFPILLAIDTHLRLTDRTRRPSVLQTISGMEISALTKSNLTPPTTARSESSTAYSIRRKAAQSSPEAATAV